MVAVAIRGTPYPVVLPKLRDPRRVAALAARRPGARRPHLQPVDHRARPLLCRARAVARGAARLLVGTDVRLARSRPRGDRHRRLRDPLAARAAAGGALVLA